MAKNKIEQVSIFASISIASVEHGKKYRCVHTQRCITLTLTLRVNGP